MITKPFRVKEWIETGNFCMTKEWLTEETRQEGACFFLHANNNTADFTVT